MDIWPFVPQVEFTETLEWRTDIISSRASEQRINTRPRPRLTISYTMMLDNQQAALARTIARTTSLTELAVPLWGEATRLGILASGITSLVFDTSNAQYEATRQVVIFDEFNLWELATVQTVSAGNLLLTAATVSAYADAYVMPVYQMRPGQDYTFSRAAVESLLNVSAAFFAVDVMDVAEDFGAVTYRSQPVLTVQPIASSSMDEQVIHASDTVDGDSGVVAVFKALNYVSTTGAMAWDVLSNTELWEVRRWLYAVRGKSRGFWRPSWGRDIQLTAPVGASDVTMTVLNIGFVDMINRDIMIQLNSGTILYRRVTTAVSAGLNETLNIDTSLGQAVAILDIDRISLMNFARLNADRVEIRHRAAKGASIRVPVTEIPAP
jgi:hypothetical protein